MESSWVEGEGSRARKLGSLGGGELGIKSGVWISEMGSSMGSDFTRISSLGRRITAAGTGTGVEDEIRVSGRRFRSGNGTIDPIFQLGFFFWVLEERENQIILCLEFRAV